MTASSSLSWEPVVLALAERGYRAIAFDTPGFGNSNPVAEPSIVAFAKRLADAATTLGLDRYIIFGHHTGATVGATIAAEHPDRVLVLATYGFTAETGEERLQHQNARSIPFTVSGKEVSDRWAA